MSLDCRFYKIKKSFLMFKDLKIRTKLIISFLLVALISVFVTGYFSYQTAKNSLKFQIIDDLILVAEVEEGAMLNFLEYLKGRLIDFSSDGFIRDSAAAIISGKKNVADLNKHLLKNKMSLDETIYGINILNMEGVVIASTAENEIGNDESKHGYFLEARELDYGEAYISDIVFSHHFETKIPALTVSTLLIDKITGEKLGVIVNFVKLNELNNILVGHKQSRLGALTDLKIRRKTLEIYLVNQNGLMITESRFSKNAILKQKVDTEPVRNCRLKNEISGIYKNYKDISVVGASMCLPNGWTVLIEIEEREAFAGINSIKEKILFTVFFILAVISLVVYLLTMEIGGSIKKLADTINKINRGDIKARVNIKSKDEIGDLAKDFNLMIDNLKIAAAKLEKSKEVGRVKTESLSIVAHQLRTPLSGIKWILESVLENKIDKETKARLLKIQKLNEKTIEIISDMLNVAKIEDNKFGFEFQKIDLLEFFGKINEIYKIKMEEKSLRFSLDKNGLKNLYLMADPEKLGIALGNLIENAINYTGKDGTIKISLKKTDGFVIIKIKDTGIGIAEKDFSKMFSKFFRGERAVSAQTAGSGIGLFITKNIIERHQGKIWFESKLNQGAAFYVELPILTNEILIPTAAE